jgi:hypothetical protein
VRARSFFSIRRAFVAILPALAAASGAGCTTGEGSGAAIGPLWILGCTQNAKVVDYGTEANPKLFDLSPTFFAGEPIEGISDGIPANRLVIRMERTGNEIQISDTLFFDIIDSGLVAHCLRGRTVGGAPDWDSTATGTLDPNVTTPWCEPNAGRHGGTRIHLLPFGPVRAALTPLATCQSNMHPPAVVSITGVAQDGWIEFLEFGDAEQPDLAPEKRTNPDDEDFKVNFGQNLSANFSVVLGDDRTETAIHNMIDIPPDPRIGGTLNGSFDFNLERGRSAQTFP